MNVFDLMTSAELSNALEAKYVRQQYHPTEPLAILNYTDRCAYDGAWDAATVNCRGLIVERDHPHRVVARPFPKFFNHGQPGAPELDLDEQCVVSDKLDGSLGILYPALPDPVNGGSGIYGWAIASRGSFTSDQAKHGTEILHEHYGDWQPVEGRTYLFEIVYPTNRIVCDYGGLDDLVLLEVLDTETGRPTFGRGTWPGRVAEEMPYRTLREALEAEPRENAEGVVVYLPRTNERVKIKQDDYMALHRILTGTNARNVWEVAAAQACAPLIEERNHWGSYLGIDPARAEQVLELGDAWIEGVPDEFYVWVRDVQETARAQVARLVREAESLANAGRPVVNRGGFYANVSYHALAKQIMQLATAETAEEEYAARRAMLLRAWREVCPEPTAPFAHSEDVA